MRKLFLATTAVLALSTIPVHAETCLDVSHEDLISMASRAPGLFKYDAHIIEVGPPQVLSGDGQGGIASCIASVKTDFVQMGARYGGSLVYLLSEGNRVRYDVRLSLSPLNN